LVFWSSFVNFCFLRGSTLGGKRGGFAEVMELTHGIFIGGALFTQKSIKPVNFSFASFFFWFVEKN